MFYVLNAAHETVGTTAGIAAGAAAVDWADRMGGTVAQHVGHGPSGEALLHCNKCGAMFLESVANWED